MNQRPTDVVLICHGPTPASHVPLANAAGLTPDQQTCYRVRIVRPMPTVGHGDLKFGYLPEIGDVWFSPADAALVRCIAITPNRYGIQTSHFVISPSGAAGMHSALAEAFAARIREVRVPGIPTNQKLVAGQNARWN